MELVDMRVLGTRAFGVSVRVRPGATKKRILTTVFTEGYSPKVIEPDSGGAALLS